uniref:Uncharacterized protein n=1 Tax=Myotis myotis TaxID=51298 RepID=A0A7J7UPU5_MYOMY|nr:hypothetical protein mMyoMyo1_008688 [Myotis myotis]
MFSCCLPVCRGRGLNRGSDESVFRRAHRWIRAHPRRRLWPFARREVESSTQVNVQHLVVEEDPWPLDWTVGHSMEGQERPEESVATGGPGDPGPVGRSRRIPPPKPPRLHKPSTSKPLFQNTKMAIFKTRSEVLETIKDEPKESEPKAPAQQVDVAAPLPLDAQHEEQDAGLEVCPPPELSPPPAGAPAAAAESGRAAEETESPPPGDEEPSLEPMEVPALEEELLPVEGPAQGPEAPAQEVDVVPITSDEQHEEQDAELEVCPPPELSPPPSAAPDGAEETGPASEETESPSPMYKEPSLEPMEVPALEKELPVEGPALGPLFQYVRPVHHGVIWVVYSFFLFEVLLLLFYYCYF